MATSNLASSKFDRFFAVFVVDMREKATKCFGRGAVSFRIKSKLKRRVFWYIYFTIFTDFTFSLLTKKGLGAAFFRGPT